MNGTPRRLRQQ